MQRWSMLVRRGTTYYFRKSIPLALRPLVGGRREVWKSLRTTNLDEAKVLSLKVRHEIEVWLLALKKQAKDEARDKLDTSPEAIARRYERRAETAVAPASVP